ncbi:hypothetical protein AVEN_272833-1, partial [Araneus ventricosus]
QGRPLRAVDGGPRFRSHHPGHQLRALLRHLPTPEGRLHLHSDAGTGHHSGHLVGGGPLHDARAFHRPLPPRRGAALWRPRARLLPEYRATLAEALLPVSHRRLLCPALPHTAGRLLPHRQAPHGGQQGAGLLQRRDPDESQETGGLDVGGGRGQFLRVPVTFQVSCEDR